jgi:predicted aspartyl protease
MSGDRFYLTTKSSAWGATAATLLALALTKGIAGATQEVSLVQDGGVYKVPALINRQLVKLFVVDSGSSDLQVPAEVFLSLYPETVGPSDFLPGSAYKLADGRTIQSERFMIRSLRIGEQEFQQVPASISEIGTPLLLGQAVLRRLGSWSIDNRRGVLVLGVRSEGGARLVGESLPKACLDWRNAPSGCAVGFVRDYFLDVERRDAAAAARKWQSISLAKLRATLARSEQCSVKDLVLVRGDATGATVQVDLTTKDIAAPATRWCGPIELTRHGKQWAIVTTRGLRRVDGEAECSR